MLYVLCGPDSFSRREALAQLRAELDSDGMLESSTVTYDARQVTPQEVIAACESVPFLASHRLVILEGVLEQAGAGRSPGRSRRRSAAGAAGAGTWQPLVDYIDRMPPTTTLVVLGGDAPSSPLLEALAAKGRLRRFPLVDQRAVSAWVLDRAKRLGLAIEGKAARLLADLVGNDLWALKSELEKLAAYAAGQPVREEDVRTLVSAGRDLEVWGLLDAVVEGRGLAALKLLRQQLRQGKSASYVLSMLQRQYRNLAMAREMMESRASGRDIGERLGMRDFAVERLLEQASRYPLARIKGAFRRLLEADAAVKRGIYDEELALELLVQDLAKPQAA